MLLKNAEVHIILISVKNIKSQEYLAREISYPVSPPSISTYNQDKVWNINLISNREIDIQPKH
jgi:hypothetical protein